MRFVAQTHAPKIPSYSIFFVFVFLPRWNARQHDEQSRKQVDEKIGALQES